jgi:hypothetical protein
MAPKYKKKILEFSQREKSAEKYFMKSTKSLQHRGCLVPAYLLWRGFIYAEISK